jgi:hypothetical protein
MAITKLKLREGKELDQVLLSGIFTQVGPTPKSML